MTEPAVTVEHIDPATLLVDVNIRTEATLDKDFLASIRDLGVLIPIVAVRTPDGALRVRHGHRRTLAAVHHGLPAVRVVVVGADDADEVNRIVSQWHENEYRAGLSTAGPSIIRFERKARNHRFAGRGPRRCAEGVA
jgi:ParB family chromosome partitioning protein